MSEQNTSPDISSFDAKAAFMNGTADELFGIATPETSEDAQELSSAEPEEVVEVVDPETESEEVVGEDDEESILDDLLDDEDDEGDSEDTVEDTESTAEGTHKVKLDGEEVEVATKDLIDFYQRNQGQMKAITRKEQEIAEQKSQLDDLQNTINHLQYQGEFAPLFYEHEAKKKSLDDAKRALAKGEEYKGISGDQLARQITSAEVIIKDEGEKLNDEYTAKMQDVEAPGRKSLESRLPDIAERFSEYAKGWGEVGNEFGFTDVELANNRDFRFYNMAQEVIETRNELAKIKEKIRAARAKRKGGKVAESSSPKKAGSSAPSKNAEKQTKSTTDDLHKRISEGDFSARAEIVKDIFGGNF